MFRVILTFKVASRHFSLRSCLGLNKLFRSMFTDSKIVKSFQLSKTKYNYIMNFGLTPYFKDFFLKEMKTSDCFRVSLDESMNKSIARGKKWMCRLAIRMKLPSRSTRNFSTVNFQDVLMPKTSLIVWLLRLKIYPLNVSCNWSALTMLDDDRCEKDYPKILILALVAYMFSMVPLSLVLRLQIGFWMRSWKLCGKSLTTLQQDKTPTLRFVKWMNFHWGIDST